MLSRLTEKKRTIGAVLVLVGFGLLIGIAGTSDIGAGGSLLALVVKGCGCLAMMGAGAKMIGGGLDE